MLSHYSNYGNYYYIEYDAPFCAFAMNKMINLGNNILSYYKIFQKLVTDKTDE